MLNMQDSQNCELRQHLTDWPVFDSEGDLSKPHCALSKVSVNEELGCNLEKEDLVNILQEISPLPLLMHPKQTTLMNRR